MRRDASRCVASPTSIFGASPPLRRARGKRARNNERATSFDAAVTAPRVDDRLARASTTDDDASRSTRRRASLDRPARAPRIRASSSTRARRMRHRIVERRARAMHADQFRDPAREDEDDDDDDDEMDARARARAWARLPTKTKCLGPTLLALGTAMLGTRALFALGAIEADAHAARGTTTALTVVGGMCALAGGYATTVMWMTARGARGWSYEMIPGE
jgi:hypothetical protein